MSVLPNKYSGTSNAVFFFHLSHPYITLGLPVVVLVTLCTQALYSGIAITCEPMTTILNHNKFCI